MARNRNLPSVRRQKIGTVAKKLLLLLQGGVALGLTRRPDVYFKIIKGISKEWDDINRRSRHNAVKRLYQSRLIDYKENADGAVALTLTESGKNKVLRYNLDNIKIRKPPKWDNYWRMVLFDIPENKKNGRDALAAKLKNLGFHPLQKSAFIYPYECKNEIDFIVEVLDLEPYVRHLLVKKTDIDPDLKNHFQLYKVSL